MLVIPLLDSRPGGIEAAYNHAWRLFQGGYLTMSEQEAESGFKKYQVSDPAWAAKFRLLEAESMLFRGMYEDALAVSAAYHGSGASNDVVEKLAIEAVALTRQQHVQAAYERLTQAEAICKNSAFPACGDELAAHAIFALKQGLPENARQFFLQALAFARTQRNDWLQASSHVNLGYTAMQVDHYDEAVDWSRVACQEAAASGFENLAQNAAGNLGWAYFKLGDHDRALEQFLSAERSAERLGNVRYQLKWLSTAGYVYRDSGEWERAAQSYREALDLARQINSREDTLIALEDLASITADTGNLNDASNYIHEIRAIENDETRPDTTLVLTMGKLAMARNQYAQAEAYFRSIQSDLGSLITDKLSAGFELAELSEAQNNTSAAERLYKATLAQYEAARAQLKSEESQLPFGTNAAQIYDRYIQLLVREKKTQAALAVADQSRAQTLEQSVEEPAARKSARSAAPSPQQIALRTNSTLLFYWLGESQSYLWAITPAKTAFFTLPPRREIADRIARYNKALLDLHDPLVAANADGQALYQELVAPAAPMLRPDSSVIVLADGALNQLDFETLLAPGPSPYSRDSSDSNGQLHYLLDDFTFSSAPSLSMLAMAKPAAERGQRILLLGNPVSADADFPPLPMFGYEMTRIESHFAAAQMSVVAGPQATPAAYAASDPHRFTYIHFVSHAVASRTSPLDSAIILSNPAGADDAYKLYAREIIRHPIDAKLVTISACYGSGTRAYAGEGLVGLSWAFLRAGAQRVIGALWEVSDESTPRLMDTLYQGLANGESPAAALRDAKLSLLHSQTKFRLPYYWAPFQLYGRR